ncbi:MAG: hypothetical protein V1917_03720 [Candidatus Gottesmanbacteria bacterium]
MKRFFHKKRNIGFLLLAVVLLSIFSWFIVSFSPLAILQYVVFYLLLFGLSITLSMYIFADVRQSLILSVGVVIYLLLRSCNLRHPVYLFLLFVCCVSVLRLFSQPKNE